MTRGTANGVVGTRLFWKPPPSKRVGAGTGTPRIAQAVGTVPPFVLEGRGACASREVDPRWFEPSYGESPDNWAGADKALAVCLGCPVRLECLAWAVADPTLEGMWGATVPVERTELRGIRRPGRPRRQAS